MKYLADFYEEVKIKSYRIKGCSEEEIESVQLYAVKQLPECYIEFLRLMGREVDFLAGHHYTFEDVKHLRGSAECMMYEAYGDNGLTFSKEDDFVFFDSQGCTCCYFNLNEGDNPPVYFYCELLTQPVKITETLLEFLIAMKRNDTSIYKVTKEYDYRNGYKTI